MYNKFIGIGRLCKDWELKFTQSGTAVATSTIAIDSGFGEKKKTDFLPVVVWQKQAESVATYTKKGSLIMVDGRVTTRNYEAKDGHKVYVTEITAENVRFLDSKKSDDNTASPNNVGKEIVFSDDDVPF